jgi:hypothetical protein
MDGITQALSAIQPELKAGTEVASLGSTAYNLYNQYQNQQYQNLLRSYAQNPAKLNAYAAQFTQPLTAGLTSAVANQTQGYLASRGLSDSPQIAQQVEAQAIAPAIQQNQQQGYNDALQALNLGGGAVPPALQQANGLSALAKAFASLPGLGNINTPYANMTQAQWQQLMQQGTVQPTAIDQTVYQPDLSASTDLSGVYQSDPATYGGGADTGGYGSE